MLEELDSVDDVLAIRVSHKITGADLEKIMDRLDALMARHEKVNVFVETQGIDGLELTSLPSYMARAMPLLGKLNKFGRVAVVADQAWIRAGTRLESAMLPNIKYRVYEPDERAEALAWVSGVGGLATPSL
ncbi:MAG TPA: STAS/SEC14 domain-containing protein [Croceibacterium sp.]|nr:STAS/SEC14 domain-containing protein [Croceibacterium sp.]